MAIKKHYIVTADGLSAIKVLSALVPEISKQKLKQAMQYGAIWLTRAGNTNRIRRVKKELYIGDELHLYYDENILFGEIPSARLVVDEGDYSIWNKPNGMLSQGTKWGDHSSITRWVELFGLEQNNISPRPCFLVHRLDRATSGLIIIAHSKKVASKLATLFETRQIEKRYTVIVSGHYPANEKHKAINSDIDGKSAKSIVLSSEYDEQTNQTKLLVKIETGRKHQIRKHLSGVGFPVVGDRLYGDLDIGEEALPDLMLRSCYLEFVCPVSNIRKVYSIS